MVGVHPNKQSQLLFSFFRVHIDIDDEHAWQRDGLRNIYYSVQWLASLCRVRIPFGRREANFDGKRFQSAK